MMTSTAPKLRSKRIGEADDGEHSRLLATVLNMYVRFD